MQRMTMKDADIPATERESQARRRRRKGCCQDARGRCVGTVRLRFLTGAWLRVRFAGGWGGADSVHGCLRCGRAFRILWRGRLQGAYDVLRLRGTTYGPSYTTSLNNRRPCLPSSFSIFLAPRHLSHHIYHFPSSWSTGCPARDNRPSHRLLLYPRYTTICTLYTRIDTSLLRPPHMFPAVVESIP